MGLDSTMSIATGDRNATTTFMDEPSEVYHALDRLYEASQQPPKDREDVTLWLDRVTDHAKRHGLSGKALNTLLNAVLGISGNDCRLDVTTSTNIFDNLFPSDKVPSSIVYGIVAKLGPGTSKASHAIQARAVRWLVQVCDVLADVKALGRLYSVLFNLLDMTALRDGLCHLLVMLTEAKHVLAFRCSALVKLAQTPQSTTYVTALLSCYHEFRPDLIPSELCVGKAASLSNPDVAWREQLEAIQQSPVAASLNRQAESHFRVAQRSIAKRAAGTGLRHLVATDLEDSGEGLENVTGVRDFVDKLPLVVWPTNLEAVLDDPLLRQYLATGPDDIEQLEQEVDLVLEAMLDRERAALGQGQPLSAKAIRVLHKVLEYAEFQKFLPESIEKFVLDALEHDACRTCIPLLLDLLAWRYPNSHAWKDSILPENTEQCILRNLQDRPELLLHHYTMVLRHRTAMYLSGTSAFDGQPNDSPAALADHCSWLASSLLAKSQNARVCEAVLSYLGTLAMVSSHASIESPLPIFDMNASTTYLLLFTNPTVASLSRLLSLLADYKKVFEDLVGTGPGQIPASGYPSDFIKRLNGFLMDSCNLFWRGRAFLTKSEDKNAAACLLQESTQKELARYVQSINSDYSLNTTFGLASHPALARPAAAAWLEVEADRLDVNEMSLLMKRRQLYYRDGRNRTGDDTEMDIDELAAEGGPLAATLSRIHAIHAGPVSRLSLQRLEAAGGAAGVSWSQYRIAVLDWLELRGSPGIGKLMKRTMKLLMADNGSLDNKNSKKSANTVSGSGSRTPSNATSLLRTPSDSPAVTMSIPATGQQQQQHYDESLMMTAVDTPMTG